MGNPVNIGVLDAMKASLSSALWAKVLRFAHGRCKVLAAMGLDVDDDLARQLVNEAVSDTALGTVKWEPTACALSTHLCGVVKRRTWHMINRHRRFKHESISRGDLRSEGVTLEASLAVHEPVGDTEQQLARKESTTRLKQALFEAAQGAGDDTVGLLLTAFEGGVYARQEVAECLGITVDEYRAAMKRLRRLLGKLPDDLRHDAQEAMRGVA